MNTPLISSVDEVLTTTRAVRRRLDLTRPVPRPVIEECVKIAQQAPIGENKERCRFVAIADPVARAAVADVYRRAVEDFVRAPARARRERPPGPALPAEPTDARVRASAVHLVEHLDEVPLLVLAGSDDRAPKAGTGFRTSEFYGTVYPAVWSFQLALRSRGLGSSLTCVHLHYADEVARLLDLPPDFVQVALLPVAYTVGLDFRAARRLPTADVLRWV